ncbi:hypothetical protein [Tessaracoccus caeni]|nr:hypothetical protein [Tessaracoccus caeni]MDF1489547.1 hypothetical protein [Tessaracoccus caeni]
MSILPLRGVSKRLNGVTVVDNVTIDAMSPVPVQTITADNVGEFLQ